MTKLIFLTKFDEDLESDIFMEEHNHKLKAYYGESPKKPAKTSHFVWSYGVSKIWNVNLTKIFILWVK